MFGKLAVFLCLATVVFAKSDLATDVGRCKGDKPFPLEVRVLNCTTPPCSIIKGTTLTFEIDFVNYFETTSLKTHVKATTLGITVPYILPEDVADVCSNLMDYAYCPLDPTEDVTYLFKFFIMETYPEIPVKIEIYLVNQDKDIVTCFTCPIKVVSGNAAGGS